MTRIERLRCMGRQYVVGPTIAAAIAVSFSPSLVSAAPGDIQPYQSFAFAQCPASMICSATFKKIPAHQRLEVSHESCELLASAGDITEVRFSVPRGGQPAVRDYGVPVVLSKGGSGAVTGALNHDTFWFTQAPPEVISAAMLVSAAATLEIDCTISGHLIELP